MPLLLALSRVTATGWSDATVQLLLTIAAASFAAFVWAERRAVEPLMPPSLFAIRTVALVSAGVFTLGMSMFGMFVYLPLYLQGVLGMSAAASGTLFVPMILAMIVASVGSGQLVSRTGRYKFLAVGGAAMATVGMALLARLGPGATANAILWCLVVCGFGFGAAQPVYALAVQNAAPPGQLGAATATSQFFRSIGSTIGVAVFGTVLLGIYHQRLAVALPPDTPAQVRAVLDNPLTMNRGAEVAAAQHLPPMDASVAAGVRSSLAAGMQRIFELAALVMAASVLLNAALPELPLRARVAQVPPADVA